VVGSNISILGAASSIADSSFADRIRKSEKISDGLLTFGSKYHVLNREEHPQCVLCGEVLQNRNFNTRDLCGHLTTKS
jgi:hypothetical protein